MVAVAVGSVTVGVGVMAVAQDQFDRRFDAVLAPVTVGMMSVPVDRGGLRLGLDDLPIVVHQELLGAGFGIPRLGEYRLQRFGIGFLLAADDLTGQGQHQVVAVVPEGRQPALGQSPSTASELCSFLATSLRASAWRVFR